MKMICEECGGKLEHDEARAESVCADCGVVYEGMLSDADTNSGSSLGENRHNEATNQGAVTQGARNGARMNPRGEQFDAHGNRLTNAAFRKYRDLARKDLRINIEWVIVYVVEEGRVPHQHLIH